MEILNAFAGKTTEPTLAELAAALGQTSALWSELVDSLTIDLGNPQHEWNSYSPKYGWSFIIKVKKRRILYLSPFAGYFQVAFILGDKAMAVVRTSKFSKLITEIIDKAPRYPEGTGIRINVKTAKPLPAVRQLARIKLAN
jgi:hypothetical protein